MITQTLLFGDVQNQSFYYKEIRFVTFKMVKTNVHFVLIQTLTLYTINMSQIIYLTNFCEISSQEKVQLQGNTINKNIFLLDILIIIVLYTAEQFV